MAIKTLGEFRKATKNLDDDFKLEIDFFKEVPEEELARRSYPYPWDRLECDLEFNDVGYSDKVACFGLYERKD